MKRSHFTQFSHSIGMPILATALIFFFSFFSDMSQATTIQCSDVFGAAEQILTNQDSTPRKQLTQDFIDDLKSNAQERGQTLAKRYPRLAFAFKDPAAFEKTMRDRFELQKKITPEDPRLFNFPEAADMVREISIDLEKFRQELIANLQTAKNSKINRLSHFFLNKRSPRVEEVTKVLQYIKTLQADLDRMIEADYYPYRDTVYNLYYYSRIRGFFQFKDLSPYHQVTKYIDMVMHGYRRLDIDSELDLYQNHGNPILQVRSGKIAHEFHIAEIPFQQAFDRKDALEIIIIPSVYPLGSSAFLHILPYKIHIVGATNTPIPADGFNRPGGLFWMHDVRHEADRYMKMTAYKRAQQLSPQQEEGLTLLQQRWHSEFLKLKSSIENEELRAAVEHYYFYTHHDVGVPLTPSLFLNHHRDGMAVYYAFLWHKKNANQDSGFNEWLKNTKEAQRILEDFWRERYGLEKELLKKEPVKIEKWEDWL